MLIPTPMRGDADETVEPTGAIRAAEARCHPADHCPTWLCPLVLRESLRGSGQSPGSLGHGRLRTGRGGPATAVALQPWQPGALLPARRPGRDRCHAAGAGHRLAGTEGP